MSGNYWFLFFLLIFLMSVLKLIGDEEGWNRGIWAVALPPAKRRALLVCIHRGPERGVFSFLSYDF